MIKKLLAVLLFLSSLSLLTAEGQRDLGLESYQGAGDALSQMDKALESYQDAMTAEDDYYVGRAVAAVILKNYPIYTGNPALTRYLNKICLAIVVNSKQPVLFNGYHVEILDSDEINAFATPGGHIFLTRALVECAASEDELAAVIAHEIAHIQLRHAAGIIENQRLVQELSATADRAASIAARELSAAERAVLFKESVRETINVLLKNGFSQSQEFDADMAAMVLLADAGYNPLSLIDILKILDKSQKEHPGGFNVTHPSPVQRIGNAERFAGNYRRQDTRPYRQSRF
ncbi:MAG: M48 family metalloprotease [Treponema sp.]|jgi:predicted Zn-dependent protease|nr:M48 family metalloprotease [Treponema sp.]